MTSLESASDRDFTEQANPQEPEPDLGDVCLHCWAVGDQPCEPECPTRRGRA